MPLPARRLTLVLVRTRRMTVTVAVIAVVAGCGSGGGDRTSPQSASATVTAGCTTTSTVNASGMSLLPIPPATVTVLDPGAAPRVEPTGSPNRDSAQTVRLVTTSTSSSVTAGQPRADEAQTVELPLTAQVLCSDPTDVELQIGSASSPDADLSRSLAATRRSRAGVAVAAGSIPISVRIVPAADADDAARSAVEQTLVQALQRTVTLPRSPIGVGARWQAVRTIDGAATVKQTITATLRARVGDSLTLDVAVEEEPVDSVFTIPGSGQSLTIASYSMSGTGSLTVDLTRGLPTGGDVTIAGGRSLVGADASRPLVQRTGVRIRWATTR